MQKLITGMSEPEEFYDSSVFIQDYHNERYPANIHLLKVSNRNTRKRCKICSKLTIKTPFSSVSIVDFE